MSMDAYAFCRRPLRSVAEWQAAIDALGFDLKLRAERDLALSRGHLSALRRGREAGFECGTISLSNVISTYEDLDFGGPWPCIYEFCFHTFPSAAGTWIAIVACISATGGMAFDPQEGLLMNVDHALDYASKEIAEIDALEPHPPD